MVKENKEDNEGRTKKVKISTIFLSTIIFLIFLFTILVVIFYKFEDNFVSDNLGKALPLPAVYIKDTGIISTNKVFDNLKSIKTFYKNQDFSSTGYRVDFQTKEGLMRLKIREKELINKMIEDKVIEDIAKEKGVRISDSLVDESVERKINEYGSDDFVRDNLENLYGWSLDDFKEKIVKPSLYKDELEDWVSENAYKEKNEKAKDEIEKAFQKIESGEDFESVAEDTSEGITSKNGGHLGLFKKEYIAAVLRKDVTSLNVDEVSGVLESKLGYHIIKLDDKNVDEEGEVIFDLSQIYVPKGSFAEWIGEKIKELEVKVLVKDYVWSQDTGMIEFSDSELMEFEKKSMKESVEDASLLPV
jgi:parvulin-like peptidyl-prolyl isomerase